MASNTSFASPLADAQYAPVQANAVVGGLLETVIKQTQGLSLLSVLLTAFIGLVVYDQC